jgi:hypothetical protein
MEAVGREADPVVVGLRAFRGIQAGNIAGRFLWGAVYFFRAHVRWRYFTFSFTSLESFACSVSTRKRL